MAMRQSVTGQIIECHKEVISSSELHRPAVHHPTNLINADLRRMQI